MIGQATVFDSRSLGQATVFDCRFMDLATVFDSRSLGQATVFASLSNGHATVFGCVGPLVWRVAELEECVVREECPIARICYQLACHLLGVEYNTFVNAWHTGARRVIHPERVTAGGTGHSVLVLSASSAPRAHTHGGEAHFVPVPVTASAL